MSTNGVLFVTGDFSGIQDYVLGITAAGGGQARRLRARSFIVQLAGEIVVGRLLSEFGGHSEDVVIHSGGQFLLRLPEGPDAESRLAALRDEIVRSLFRDLHGELALTVAWGRSLEEALERKEQEKRRPWRTLLTGAGGWRTAGMALGEIGRPCEICRRQTAVKTRRDAEESVEVCHRCDQDTEIGKALARRDATVSLGPSRGAYRLLDWGFDVRNGHPRDGPLGRLRRHVPADGSGRLLTFEEIAARSRGDNLLGVLKADVDKMGPRIAEICRQDPSHKTLRRCSEALETFFGQELQRRLEAPEWSLIYTVYSGGDDLLMIGPWNLILDFALEMQRLFSRGPGAHWGLTISAGAALMQYALPVRHGVERADELLEQAKVEPKNRFAFFGGVFDWSSGEKAIEWGKRLAGWIDGKVCPRTQMHRLLRLAGATRPGAEALWAYELARNFPRRDDRRTEQRAFRQWGEEMLRGGFRSPEGTAAMRYALTATRPRRD